MKQYKTIDHTADIGVEAWGTTKQEAMEAVVEAMFDLMAAGDSVVPRQEKKVVAVGTDDADRMINLLREALYFFHGERWIGKTCRIPEMKETQVTAYLQGEPYDPQRHVLKMEIKAATYHQLKLEPSQDRGWYARVIFDV